VSAAGSRAAAPPPSPAPSAIDALLELIRQRIAAHEHLQAVAIEHGVMERARQHDAVIDELRDLVVELERGTTT
jgi:hypothetical protein